MRTDVTRCKLLFIPEAITDDDIRRVACIQPQSICTWTEEHLSLEMDYSSFIWFETRFPGMDVESPRWPTRSLPSTTDRLLLATLAILLRPYQAIEYPTSICEPPRFRFNVVDRFAIFFFEAIKRNQPRYWYSVSVLKIDPSRYYYDIRETRPGLLEILHFIAKLASEGKI